MRPIEAAWRVLKGEFVPYAHIPDTVEAMREEPGLYDFNFASFYPRNALIRGNRRYPMMSENICERCGEPLDYKRDGEKLHHPCDHPQTKPDPQDYHKRLPQSRESRYWQPWYDEVGYEPGQWAFVYQEDYENDLHSWENRHRCPDGVSPWDLFVERGSHSQEGEALEDAQYERDGG